MARPRKDQGGASFDSLLDTMTNVVGILVMILIVTLLGVREAVRRIEWKIPDVSVAELEKLREDTADKEKKVAANKEDIAELLKLIEEIDKLKKEKEELEKQVKPISPEEKVAQVEASVKELRQKMAEAQLETQKKQEEIEQLKQKLLLVPEANEQAKRIIRMPNPRPTPPGSKPIYFMCHDNRIAMLDPDKLIEALIDQLERSKDLLVAKENGKRVKVPKDKEDKAPEALRGARNWVFDPEKIVKYFEQKNFNNRTFRLFVEVDANGREYATLEMLKGAGEGPEQVHAKASDFVRDVRDIDPEKNYVIYLVWPDSFEVYVRAREVTEYLKIPAGWQIHTEPKFRIPGNLGVWMPEEIKPPPPPKPEPPGGAPKPPPKPPPPRPPQTVLD